MANWTCVALVMLLAAASARAQGGPDWAARTEAAARCTEAARRAPDAEARWRALGVCVDAGHFDALASLLGGAWDADLLLRSDAPRLLSRVIAMRGGDVERDLTLVHERRVPLFSLAEAMARPGLYRGRWVLVRAQAIETPSSTDLRVAEVHLVADPVEVELGPRSYASTRWQGSPPLHDSTAGTVWGTSVRRWRNLDVATGREALVRLPDPFFDPQRVYLVLARFDGVRAEEDGEVALLSASAYFVPGALVAY
jgi:hypothetical protein